LGLGLEVCPSSIPFASGVPLLQPLRLVPHLCQLELQPVPLRLLRRAKPRALRVALLQALRRLQPVREQARLLRLRRARRQPPLELHRRQPLPLCQSAARRHLLGVAEASGPAEGWG
jgi:hypothetical protein